VRLPELDNRPIEIGHRPINKMVTTPLFLLYDIRTTDPAVEERS
jgi:hypothetical protein